MEIVIEGLPLGLAYAAPIGIQNMYVINAALKMRKRQALICGATVDFFDITLALTCFFGIGSIITQPPAAKSIIMCLGGVLLIYMGVKIIVRIP